MSQKLWRKNQPTRNIYDLKGGDLCKQEKNGFGGFRATLVDGNPSKTFGRLFVVESRVEKKIARHFMSSSILSEYLT